MVYFEKGKNKMNLPAKPVMITVSVAMLSLMGLILFSDNGLVELNRLKREKKVFVQKNRLLTQKNDHLRRTIQRLKSDPIYVEHIARSELGMIGTYQVIFKLSAARRGKPPDKESPDE